MVHNSKVPRTGSDSLTDRGEHLVANFKCLHLEPRCSQRGSQYQSNDRCEFARPVGSIRALRKIDLEVRMVRSERPETDADEALIRLVKVLQDIGINISDDEEWDDAEEDQD